MTKLPRFPRFDYPASIGDTSRVTIGDLVAVAVICADDDLTSPEERDEGFWPSLDPRAAGYIGDGKGERSLAVARANARRILKAWKNDEWHYVGVSLCWFVVADDGSEVAISKPYEYALWGVEMNYPTGRTGKRNAYLSEVAGELLAESFEAAQIARYRVKPLVVEIELRRDQLPAECLTDIAETVPGRPRADMLAHWRDQLHFSVRRLAAVAALSQLGFDLASLAAMSDAQIAEAVLWYAVASFCGGSPVFSLA